MNANAFLEDPLVRCYIFYAAILIVKILAMPILTMKQRKFHRSSGDSGKSATQLEKEKSDDVERVRRANLNDLENIPIFLVICALYIATGPRALLAGMLIRVYTLARIAHTAVYAVCVVQQPARGIAWGVGFAITFYMAISVLMTVM